MKHTLVFATALALAACSQGLSKGDSPSLENARIAAARRTCAFGVRDAVATAEDRPGGVALAVVSRHDVAELRARVRSAAEMRGPGSRQGPGHDGLHGMGGKHGLQAMQLPPVRATVDDIEQGARVTLVAMAEADVDKLRTAVRDRVAQMNGGCD